MPVSLRLVGIAAFSGWMTALFSVPLAALGQITPDTTLGAESSQVLPIGSSGFIFGGATRGANLFHSFSEFNVAEGEFAAFTNPVGIERIFSRVTGGSVSNISGVLGVVGDADLFFLNPNGILFGPRSSLAVAGSFVATTADGFVFEDNQLFNARNPAPAPLLAVNVPIGLQYGNQQPGIIRSRSILLNVNPNQSLLLAGGDVVLENSSISVLPGSGGQIQIAAIDDVGVLDFILDNDLISLDIETDLNRSDVSITNSKIAVSSDEKTSIAISASNIDISGSLVFTGIEPGLGFPGAETGDIRINADSLALGNLTVISTSAFGEGSAGNLIIQVSGPVSLDGSGILGSVLPNTIGDGGEIELTAGSLSLTNGAFIDSSTFGEGNAGNLILQVDSLVSLDSSGLGSTVAAGAIGAGGTIKLVAGALSLTNGASIDSSTLGEGNAGNLILQVNDSISLNNSRLSSTSFLSAIGESGDISLTAESLSLTNGASIDSSTLGKGNAGNLILQVDDSVSLNNSRLSSNVFLNAIGEDGMIELTAGSLSLTNGSVISAISLGQGNPGDIDLKIREGINLEQGFITSSSFSLLSERGGNIAIDAGSLNLDGSLISTETLNSQGGNIAINLDDLLIMRDGSLISTTAGTAQAGGNGGNIDITADFIIGVREENSDIAADAFAGNGGQITISALDIFGLEFREERTSFSDITASSEQGASGITTFNRLTPVDVRQGLTELPENVVDPTGLIDRSCNTSAVQNSEFVITGRGGLPPEPDERSDNSQFFDDLGPIVTPSNSAEAMAEPLPSKNGSPDSIQEAQGWIVNDMGQIQLIAAVPNEASVRTATSPCN